MEQEKPSLPPWAKSYWEVVKEAMGLKKRSGLDLLIKFCLFCRRPLRQITKLGLEAIWMETYVFHGRKRGHQIVELKHKTDLLPAVLGELTVGHGSQVFSVHPHLAGGGPIRAADDVQQGGFSSPGGPYELAELSPLDLQVQAAPFGLQGQSNPGFCTFASTPILK